MSGEGKLTMAADSGGGRPASIRENTSPGCHLILRDWLKWCEIEMNAGRKGRDGSVG